MASGLPAHVASGELITSVWGNAVVDELARQRLEVWNTFFHGGGSSPVYGTFDNGQQNLGPFTFPVRVTVLAMASGGWGGSGIVWHGDIVRVYDSVVVASSFDTFARQATYQNITIPSAYDVPVGQNAGFRTRTIFTTSEATPITIYYSATGIFFVQRTDIA
jgi:hypothetical protein